MQACSRPCYRVGTVLICLLAANGCSPQEEPLLDHRTEAGSTEKKPANLGGEVNPKGHATIGKGSGRTPTGDAPDPEDSRLSDGLDTNVPPATHERGRTDDEPTIISSEDLGQPVSPEELLNNPMMKELARRQASEIEGLRIKYDYGGAFGMDGIADSALAYVDDRLVGEAKALRLAADTPSTIEVEVKHYSRSGEVIYRAITMFAVGNVWRPGDDPVLPGAPFSSRVIEGSTEKPIFSRWPVGGPL